jgi:DNA primase
VLALPGGADPDKFLKEQGADAYRGLLSKSPPYLDYLISRARKMDQATAESKLAALNFLMPYVQRIPNNLLRSEWASRIASELRVEAPVLREALRIATSERRSQVKPRAELLAPVIKPAERRLMQMLLDAAGFRERLANEISSANLHRGLETERIFDALIAHASQPLDAASIAASLDDRDRQLLLEIVFEAASEPVWAEAESCLSVLRDRRVEEELFQLQKQIEAKPAPDVLPHLLKRRLELQRDLATRKAAGGGR